MNEALSLRALSEPAAALSNLQEEAMKARQAEDPVRRGWALTAFAAAAAETGEWQPAAEAARKLLSLVPATAAEPEWFGWNHQAHLILAEAALVGGDAEEALSWLDQAVPNDVPPGEFWSPGERLTLRAWALAERGDSQAMPAVEAARLAVDGTTDLRLRAIMQMQLAHGIRRLARDARQAAPPRPRRRGGVAVRVSSPRPGGLPQRSSTAVPGGGPRSGRLLIGSGREPARARAAQMRNLREGLREQYLSTLASSMLDEVAGNMPVRRKIASW